MKKKKDWFIIEKTYPVGSLQTGVVVYHAPFGIFVDIGGNDYLGIVQITDFLDEGIMNKSLYPSIGSTINAKVIGYTYDDRKQIWLSLKPSVLQSKM